MVRPVNEATLPYALQHTLRWLQQQPWQKDEESQNGSVTIPAPKVRRLHSVNHTKGDIERLIKRLEADGVISQQEPYPVKDNGANTVWYITMKLADLANMGIMPGQHHAQGI